MKKSILLVLSFFSFICFAQTSDIKSVIIQLDKSDVEGKSNWVHTEIQRLEHENKDKPKNLSLLRAFQSRLAIRKENFERARNYIEQALENAEKSKDNEALANAYYAQSFYLRYLGINDLSLDYANKALEFLPKDTNYHLEALIYYTLYALYSDWDNIEKMEEYIALCMSAAQKARDYEVMANAYSAKSTIMKLRFQRNRSVALHDSVLYYSKKVEELYRAHPKDISARTYAISAINTANFYFEKWMGNHSAEIRDSILSNLQKVHKTLGRVFDKDEIVANAMGMEAILAMKENRPKQAEQLLQNAYAMLQSHNPPLYYTLTNVCEGLSHLYEGQGDYQKALFYKDKQKAFQDSIYKKQQIENTYKTEALYKNKQIKRELEIAQQTSEARQTRNYLLIAVVVLLSGSLFFLFRYSQQKMKFQREKALRLQQEKAEAEMKIQLEKEEQKRLRAEQELLQLKNQRIEKENLAKSLQIQRKNELLGKIRAEKDLNLQKILREEKRIDESLETSLNEFKSIHPQFFEKLNELSEGRLTPLDQRYCGYLYLNLSTKEIATIFSVEPKSVRMTKYRIKQKLNLAGEQSLEEFLRGLEG
ncbi:hypothetical protein [Ornithobacterium rhinotracheale]|uniref:hypothetical protein n=1 Tax=Ornithobacterium rhinotracheale TaxID=28251 RepID=UPI001FF5D4F3|nr:hypothetical protein [Ornithobacterium rhinotracheale]MCK0205098.1 hypothetical protein [Ornithobacterium rhinotracheale]